MLGAQFERMEEWTIVLMNVTFLLLKLEWREREKQMAQINWEIFFFKRETNGCDKERIGGNDRDRYMLLCGVIEEIPRQVKP